MRARSPQDYILTVIVLVTTVLVLAGLVRGAFVNESEALRALETQGYSDASVTDHSWFTVGLRGCDQNDAARFTAIANNPLGKKVEVYVCSGRPFKGSTIRTK